MNKAACTLFSAIMLMLIFSGCKPKTNLAKEEEAIKSVINAETQAWIDKDPEKMKEYYIQDEYQTRVNIQDSVYSITTGWDKRSTAIDTLTKYADWIGVDQFKVEKDFLVIKVMDRHGMGHPQRNPEDDLSTVHRPWQLAIIYIVLEKEKGDWKISCFVKSSI